MISSDLGHISNTSALTFIICLTSEVSVEKSHLGISVKCSQY